MIGTRGSITIAAVVAISIIVVACRPPVSASSRENSRSAVRVVVDHRAPVRLSGASPVAPAAARRAGQRGPVPFEVRIDETGAVTVQKVLRG